MVDAYKIGISIGLTGDVAQIIQGLIREFATLDQAIERTQGEVKTLVEGMRSITAEARTAAAAWNEVAKSMQSVANATARASRGVSGGAAAAAAGITSNITAAPSATRMEPPAGMLMLPAPYRSNATDFTLQGNPYTPYGESPQIPYRGPGTDLVPFGSPQTGFTLNGGPQPGTDFTMSGNPYHGGVVGPWSPTGLAGSGGGGAGVPGGPGGPGGFGPGGIPIGPLPWGARGLMPPGMPGGYQYSPGSAPNFSNGMMSGIGAYGGYEFLKNLFENAAAIDSIRSKLMQQGFTGDEATRAYHEAFDVQRAVLGTSIGGNLNLMSDLMTVTQNKQIATDPRLVEEYAKLGVVLSGTGHSGEIGGLMSAIRSTEFRGIMMHKGANGQEEIDVPEITKFLKLITAMNVVSGGSIGPDQILQNLRAAGTAGAMISDDSLVKQMALMIAMSPARAGRGLQGFEQQFTAGRMSEAAAHLLLDMHVINGPDDPRNNPYMRKLGMGQFQLLPGAMPPGMMEEAAQSPDVFIMQHLLPKMQQYLHTHYGAAYDNGDDKTKKLYETQFATQIASRIPGGVAFAETIRNMFLMERDAEAVQKQLHGPDAYGIAVANDPALRAKGLGNAANALSVTLGNATMDHAIQVLDGFTKDLNQLADFSNKYGESTKVVLEAMAGAFTGLGVAGLVAVFAAMGATATALAAVGVGVMVTLEALQNLEKWLQSVGVVFTDKQAKEHSGPAQGVPWWMFAPGSEEPPSWFKKIQHGLSDPLGRHPSSAPILGQSGGSGVPGEPVPVRITNPGDLVHGVAGGISNSMNRPPSGVTSSDPTMDATESMWAH